MKEYVLGLCCAAILVAILESIGMGRAGKLLTGLFLALVLLSPLRDIELPALWQAPEELYLQGQSIAEEAREESRWSVRDSIIRQTRSYILDEAEDLGVPVTVEVIALDEETLAPIRVVLGGQAGSADRNRLQERLARELGIGLEGIEWSG